MYVFVVFPPGVTPYLYIKGARIRHWLAASTDHMCGVP